jgi:hypothetical protein
MTVAASEISAMLAPDAIEALVQELLPAGPAWGKAGPPTGPPQPKELTKRDAGFIVHDAQLKRLSAVVRLGEGRYAAWGRRQKLGEFSTSDAAEGAVRTNQKDRL